MRFTSASWASALGVVVSTWSCADRTIVAVGGGAASDGASTSDGMAKADAPPDDAAAPDVAAPDGDGALDVMPTCNWYADAGALVPQPLQLGTTCGLISPGSAVDLFTFSSFDAGTRLALSFTALGDGELLLGESDGGGTLLQSGGMTDFVVSASADGGSTLAAVNSNEMMVQGYVINLSLQ